MNYKTYLALLRLKMLEFAIAWKDNKKGAVKLAYLLGEIFLAICLLPLIYAYIQLTNITGWDPIIATLWQDYFFILLVVAVVVGFIMQIMPRGGKVP
jgi:hypothetical protein